MKLVRSATISNSRVGPLGATNGTISCSKNVLEVNKREGDSNISNQLCNGSTGKTIDNIFLLLKRNLTDFSVASSLLNCSFSQVYCFWLTIFLRFSFSLFFSQLIPLFVWEIFFLATSMKTGKQTIAFLLIWQLVVLFAKCIATRPTPAAQDLKPLPLCLVWPERWGMTACRE